MTYRGPIVFPENILVGIFKKLLFKFENNLETVGGERKERKKERERERRKEREKEREREAVLLLIAMQSEPHVGTNEHSINGH